MDDDPMGKDDAPSRRLVSVPTRAPSDSLIDGVGFTPAAGTNEAPDGCYVCGRLNASIRTVEGFMLSEKPGLTAVLSAVAGFLLSVSSQPFLRDLFGPGNIGAIAMTLCPHHRLLAGWPPVLPGPSAELLEKVAAFLRPREPAEADKAAEAARRLWAKSNEDLEALERFRLQDPLGPGGHELPGASGGGSTGNMP